MTATIDLISFENDVFKTYVFWLSILIIKTLLMAIITIQTHLSKAKLKKNDAAADGSKPKHGRDPDVERVRRAHRNDLENVLPLLIIGYFYVLTNPAAGLAKNLFRIAGISRIVHTLVYAVWVIPQPARGIAYGIPAVITTFMAVQTLLHCI